MAGCPPRPATLNVAALQGSECVCGGGGGRVCVEGENCPAFVWTEMSHRARGALGCRSGDFCGWKGDPRAGAKQVLLSTFERFVCVGFTSLLCLSLCLSPYSRSCTLVWFFTGDKVPPGFPTIAPSQNTKVVEIGHNAVLHCTVTGNPPPKITWIRDALPIDMAANPRYTVLESRLPGKLR